MAETSQAQTFTGALQLQCDIILKIARRLDEKGYAVVAYKMNPDASHERHPYTYLLGALARFATDWGEVVSKHRSRVTARRPIFVNVWPQEWVGTARQDLEVVRRTGRVFDHPFTFRCMIPVRVRYREIHAALAVMTHKANAFGGQQVTDRLNSRKRSDTIEYMGSTRDQLEILLRVLEMPQHQKILLGR